MNDKIDNAEFVVKSKVKVLFKEAGMNVSAEVWNELGHCVSKAAKIAIVRAKANGRKTVKACDV